MKSLSVLFVILICGCASEHQHYDRLIKPKHDDLATGQPTLRWDPKPGSNITYDVVLYEAVQLNPSWVPGRKVDYVEGLTEPFYKVAQPLAPGEYCWSIRVRRGDHVEQWRLRDGVSMDGLVMKVYDNQYARFRIPEKETPRRGR